MNTAIYLRKSRNDDPGESMEETLRRHKETLLEFAKRQPSMNIVKIYEEVVSGDNLYSRPEMLKLLEDCDKQIFDSVLCIDIDRLGRGNMTDQGIIINTFKFNNIKIITQRGVYDPNDERDEDSLELETLKARWEYKSIRRRLHNGTVKSINEGCYLWEAPYGYKNTRIDKKKCTLEIFEDEAKFVRMMFELYLNGTGTQTIANIVNSMGAKPHRSDKFNRTSIVAILKNQVYIGKIVYNKKSTLKKGARGNDKHIVIYHDKKDWTVVDGLHPPIIDEETFNRVGEILKSRYHKPYNDGTVLNPLSGILKCANCGSTMQRRPFATKKNTTEHLLCQTKGCCKSSRLDYVEKAVIENIESKLAEIKSGELENRPAMDYTSALQGIKDEIKNLIKQKNNLYDFLERGIYDVDTFTERSQIIADRTAELNAQYDDLLDKQEKVTQATPENIIARFENVLKLYESSSPAIKNELLKTIIADGTYYKEKSWKSGQFVVTIKYKDIYDF